MIEWICWQQVAVIQNNQREDVRSILDRIDEATILDEFPIDI